MKAVILAAGYGTRLQRDMVADSSGRFAHLAGTAKPLLPVGRCSLISHWVHALTASGCVDCIYVVTNALYCAAFEEWASLYTNVKILSDQTRSNDERLGAVACLHLAVKHFNIEDHVLVVGGDTLFKEEFSLSKVKERFNDLQAKCEDSCLVLSYQCREEETHKYGILEVDSDLRVLCMKEKPLPSETKSRRACPCFYALSKKSLPLLDTFLEEKKEAPIDEKDAPGNFVSWLIPRLHNLQTIRLSTRRALRSYCRRCAGVLHRRLSEALYPAVTWQRQQCLRHGPPSGEVRSDHKWSLETHVETHSNARRPVYIHQISGHFDVGNLPSYIECDLYFREKLQGVESYMV